MAGLRKISTSPNLDDSARGGTVSTYIHTYIHTYIQTRMIINTFFYEGCTGRQDGRKDLPQQLQYIMPTGRLAKCTIVCMYTCSVSFLVYVFMF